MSKLNEEIVETFLAQRKKTNKRIFADMKKILNGKLGIPVSQIIRSGTTVKSKVRNMTNGNSSFDDKELKTALLVYANQLQSEGFFGSTPTTYKTFPAFPDDLTKIRFDKKGEPLTEPSDDPNELFYQIMETHKYYSSRGSYANDFMKEKGYGAGLISNAKGRSKNNTHFTMKMCEDYLEMIPHFKRYFSKKYKKRIKYKEQIQDKKRNEDTKQNQDKIFSLVGKMQSIMEEIEKLKQADRMSKENHQELLKLVKKSISDNNK